MVLGRADTKDLAGARRRGQLDDGSAECTLGLGDEDPIVLVDGARGRSVEGTVRGDVRRNDTDGVGGIDAVVLAVNAGRHVMGVDLGLLLLGAMMHLATDAVHLGDALLLFTLQVEAFDEG